MSCRCVRCSFFTDTRYFWLGCTEFPPCNYEVSRGLRLLYALELGYYVQVVDNTSLCVIPKRLCEQIHDSAMNAIL